MSNFKFRVITTSDGRYVHLGDLLLYLYLVEGRAEKLVLAIRKLWRK